jgi:hypothetical protein
MNVYEQKRIDIQISNIIPYSRVIHATATTTIAASRSPWSNSIWI